MTNKETIERIISRCQTMGINAAIETYLGNVTITCGKNIFTERYIVDDKYLKGEEEAYTRLLELIFVFGLTRKGPLIVDGIIQD